MALWQASPLPQWMYVPHPVWLRLRRTNTDKLPGSIGRDGLGYPLPLDAQLPLPEYYVSPEEIARLPYRPCVGLMILNAANRVFVGRRIDTAEPAWQMPQGGIDEGEQPRQAALRELTEETGLKPDAVSILAESRRGLTYDLPIERVPSIWGGRFRGQRQHWFLLRLLVDDRAIDIHTELPEFDAWRWLAAEELVAQAIEFKRAVYAQVLEEFAPHLETR